MKGIDIFREMILITVIGFISTFILWSIFLKYLVKYVKTPLDVRLLGDWALVTGATDGIGNQWYCFSYNDGIFAR